MSDLTQFDRYLSDGGPAALVIREYLMPVDGPDGVIFPATFAAGDGFPGGYNIDEFPDGTNVCLIDTVGSQANRIEPLFMQEGYKHLVPQVVIRAAEQQVNLLQAGHRAGDAVVRCSALQDVFKKAFQQALQGDFEPLAKIAPTSLVFGAWDSRDTQAKVPRLVSSTIRAFNVKRLTRSAVYLPPLDYAALEVFSDEDKQKAEGNPKNPLAQRGFVHNPASGAHGGVIATGGIRRDATLSLAALRLLSAREDAERTLALQRYILGLALVAFTANTYSFLRQGCMLVLDSDKPREACEVSPSGERTPFTLSHEDALQYAEAAAQAFGVGDSTTANFDKQKAKRDVEEVKKKSKKAKKAETEDQSEE